MFILENINKFKNKKAIITQNNGVINYQTLIDFSDKISRKIKSRSLAFLICGNNVESIAAYISFLRTNCVIALLDQGIHDYNLNNLINIYRPRFIFLKKKK